MSSVPDTAAHLGGELEAAQAQLPHVGEVCPYSTDAYPDVLDYFKDLREKAPVLRMADGTYALSKYEDVMAALRDPETFSSHHELAVSPVERANFRSVVYSDDPVHLDLRQLINRAWTPRSVLELLPAVEAEIARILGPIQPGEEFDVLSLGQDIALHVFADAMGLPLEQHDRVRAWAVSASIFVRPKRGEAPPPSDSEADEIQKRFSPGYEDMKAYFSGLVANHAGHDRASCKTAEGLPPFPLAVLAAVDADPDNLQEILHRILPPLHAGGTSTIAHIFPNIVDLLLDNDELWQRLRDDPSLLDVHSPSEPLEEMFRLKAVVQGLPRRTTRDVDIRGTHIPAGSLVHLYYISGSHDDEVFPDADEFQLRGITRHLGFGFGTHSCMGQSLVRLQTKVFLRTLTEKFDRLERVPADIQWGSLGVYYTPNRLPVVGHRD